ncbi:BTAD domain-containing putative transcriptional regulator [Streptomyces sp. NPDC047046]|uniref:LysM peptidoglycan-binding domain-containing protein n=1 Tax=Streptomyces sp. NPDC047046 TaxID=3155378 RepID=UPI0033D6ECF3
MARSSARSASPMPVPPRPRRTFGDVMKALLAVVALLALVLGVPFGLIQVGRPVPDGPPGEWLSSAIDAETLIRILMLVVWIAWAQFTACVLVEVKAAVSGVGLPARVPGAGPSQLLARQLVAAVLLLGATAASFTPGISGFGQQAPDTHRPTVAAAQQTPGGLVGGERQNAADALARQAEQIARQADTGQTHHQSTKFYRIQPPEGRHHDSLWEIAQRHLDDGRRYKEIYALNKDRVQPDGSRLSEASLIRPGWIMEMPADAHGGELVETPGTNPELSKAQQRQLDAYAKDGQGARGGHAEQGGHGARAQQRPAARDGDTTTGHFTVPAHHEHAAAEETATPPATESAAPASHGPGLPEALLGAPLLAAGLLAALGRRRRAALWQAATAVAGRRRGMELPTPSGDEADAQDALFAGADPGAVRFLDQALRSLARALAAEDRPLPLVYAAWLGTEELHLQLAEPAGPPPAPWTHGEDETFWRLEGRELPTPARESSGTAEPRDEEPQAAPYPGLVSLGAHDGSRLLLNLEAVPGLVSLSGAPADRQAVLSSVAAELATNGWSDRMTVTLVGFGADLVPLAPSRLRPLDDVAALLDVMEAETASRRAGLGAAGADSVLTGRTGPSHQAGWAAHLVLLAAEPDAEQAARLAELASDAARLGIGYLVGTEGDQLPGAAWEMEITTEGRLLAPLLGLELDAQLLPAPQHAAIARLFAAADAFGGGGDDDPAGPAVAHRPPFLVDISEQGRPSVYARLVGRYELMGLDAPDDERGPLLREALALLLLHREGVHPRVLASALWPRGVGDDVREATVARLRDWLGTDEDGRPRLREDATGRLVLDASVVSDLDVLRSLYHEATSGRGADDRAVRGRLLTDALGLVRGPLLAERPAGRYGWLAHEIVDAQLPLLVADIGLALATFHLERDRAPQAAEALERALVSAGTDERLWNELLRAVHATGDEPRLRALATEFANRSGARGLPPRTAALLDELLPGAADSGEAGTA